MKPSPSVTILIPTLNEEATLPTVLDRLPEAADGVAYEVLVVDGGSTDGTEQVALRSGVRWRAIGRPGRAQQMNRGAEEATGQVLLFLHADTLLPAGALHGVMHATGQGMVGGGFRRRFTPRHPFLEVTCWLADLRGRAWGVFLGDQAMFVRRDVFQRIGGFAPMRQFEDLDLSLRLRREGEVALIESPVTSSGRRFRARGPSAQTFRDLWATLWFLCGRPG